MKKKIGFDFLIPLVAVTVFTLFNLLSFYRMAEGRIYDLLLHIKPAVAEDESILLIDVDDLAIAEVGVWPWGRNIMADGLILLKEFEANYAVFDIEYVDKSPLGVNADILTEEIPELFTEEFSTINQNVSDLFKALQVGSISLKDAEEYVYELSDLTEMSQSILLEKVAEIARDNDKYLGQAARLFGNTFFTVTMLGDEDRTIPEELKGYVLKEIPLNRVRVESELPIVYPDIRPAILPVIEGASGAGFPNVVIDDDGVRRRINLISKYKDWYFPQLALAPLLDWLGNPEVIIKRNSIVLKEAQLPGGQAGDITLPLAENGSMLINWPKKGFLESFRHITYYELVLHNRLEKNLIHNLKIMESYGFLHYYQGESGLLDPYFYGENIRQEVMAGASTAAMADYREVRAFFFQEAGAFLNSEVEAEILGEIEAVLSMEEVPEATKESYREIKEMALNIFTPTRALIKSLAESRSKLKESLAGAFCIIGHTGTSTTDIGVNPFEKEYMNVGTHASLVNTILSGRYLDEYPWWYSAVLAMVLAFIVTLVIRRLNPLPSIVVGIAFLILLSAAQVGFFLITGIYINLLTPLLAVFFTFIALTLFKFLILEKEKSFLRNAFSHYLSTDVINELISDPDKLNLGGEKKVLTAFFTDVQGFSTISENMDPTDLVKLLNAYLTEMSNIILDLRGTIDKYEGDAIISFFGAPIKYGSHAENACLAAVRMKKMESRLNEHFLRESLSPNPLLTRMGINTGEMVVGNMGTAKKMDYTIMGNSVNLAARLEGVNKQYGTWVLISEDTCQAAGDGFTVRKLDRVRVVGIQKPVRLFELVDEKGSTKAKTKEAFQVFQTGLDFFEQKRWDDARGKFREVLKIIPDDGPANVYIKRCQNYKRKAPAENWDGVFNLTLK